MLLKLEANTIIKDYGVGSSLEQLQGEMEAIATDTHTTIEMQPRLRNEPL